MLIKNKIKRIKDDDKLTQDMFHVVTCDCECLLFNHAIEFECLWVP